MQERSVESEKRWQAALKDFSNLLKEFPASGDETFVYDASTLEKISRARVSLDEMAAILQGRKSPSSDGQPEAIKAQLDILRRLINELPLDAADQFLYDPDTHRLVTDAREAVSALNDVWVE